MLLSATEMRHHPCNPSRGHIHEPLLGHRAIGTISGTASCQSHRSQASIHFVRYSTHISMFNTLLPHIPLKHHVSSISVKLVQVMITISVVMSQNQQRQNRTVCLHLLSDIAVVKLGGNAREDPCQLPRDAEDWRIETRKEGATELMADDEACLPKIRVDRTFPN